MPSVSARVNLTQIYVDVLSNLHVMLRHDSEIIIRQNESHVHVRVKRYSKYL